MPIRVTCPGCHTRFNVSEKHAGKEGPCPKCKKTIKIPAADEEVVIHVPEVSGPKDSRGRAIIAPLKRKETRLSSVQITLIITAIVGFFLGAVVMNVMVPDKTKFPMPVVWAAAALIAVPIVFAAYTFLRDQELGSFRGRELWIRVGVCSLIYVGLWLLMPVAKYAFDGYELGSWGCAIGGMIAAGAATAMLLLDFDYLMGIVHYGMYLGICLLGRLIVGIGVLPGMLETSAKSNATLDKAAALLDPESMVHMLHTLLSVLGLS
jgi:predicted Zn finger-like uncharacterized protein